MSQPLISAVVDRKAILESLDNDSQFLETLIGIFLTDCPGLLNEIRVAVIARDAGQIMRAAHVLKGSVSFFGPVKAVQAAQVLESMGKEANLEGIDEAFSTFEREMASVSLALEEIAKGA
jgi:HPt (histidine-containing phosphotransfer) domain-containing protein